MQAARPAPGSFWLDVLDVGQGLAAVVRTAHHTLLYDTGPAFSSDADSGSRIVVPYLRGEGVSRLDGLIVSHDDSDHSGGTVSVLQALPVGVGRVLAARRQPAARPGARGSCAASPASSWEWDGVRFEMLHPSWASYNAQATRDNDRSCVLRVVAAGGSVLLTADIERGAEAQVLERAPAQRWRADVLLVPHHGSATSSSDGFLAQIRPRIAVVPVGYRNRFGHPAAEVLARYARAGRDRLSHRPRRRAAPAPRRRGLGAGVARAAPSLLAGALTGDHPGARGGRRRRAARVARRGRRAPDAPPSARWSRSAFALASECYAGTPTLATASRCSATAARSPPSSRDLHMEGESLAAALLSAMPEAATGWPELVSERVGAPVAALVEGVARMAQIQGLRSQGRGRQPAGRARRASSRRCARCCSPWCRTCAWC